MSNVVFNHNKRPIIDYNMILPLILLLLFPKPIENTFRKIWAFSGTKANLNFSQNRFDKENFFSRSIVL